MLMLLPITSGKVWKMLEYAFKFDEGRGLAQRLRAWVSLTEDSGAGFNPQNPHSC